MSVNIIDNDRSSILVSTSRFNCLKAEWRHYNLNDDGASKGARISPRGLSQALALR